MMHWWNSAFSSSSKSHSQDDSSVRYSSKSGFFSSHRKLRHRTDSKLPVPELVQRDPKLSSSGFPSIPLPSPRDKVQMVREKGSNREMKNDVVDGLDGVIRFVGQESRNYVERSETQSRKLPQKKNVKERSSQTYSIDIPTSAPTSPYSSPLLSSPGSDMMSYPPTPTGVFQVWSAPAIPHSDRNLGFGYHWPHMRTASSLDNSPLQSPRGSTPRPVSPFSSTVHPLPLPPGASQPSPISPVASKPSQSNPISSNAALMELSGGQNSSLPSMVSPVASEHKMKPVKSQWQKGKLIGRGTFGSVYVASNRRTGALCAMKEVDILPDDSKSAECMRQLEQEIKVLSHLKHPNIVQYHGSEIVGDKFHIYLEYVHPGPINKFIQDHFGAITESVVRSFTRHILSGLAYLHSKKTIHRDIKGANLLVDAYGVVKLADFGMAKHLSGQASVLSLKGSPYWLAPELLQPVKQTDASSEVGLAVDIWSLGCTIIEMMNGKPPWSEYEGPVAIFKALQETPPIPETMSAVGKDFLHCCFRRNPADRPTSSKLLEHPFVSSSQQPDACFQSPKERRLSENMKILRGVAESKT